MTARTTEHQPIGNRDLSFHTRKGE
jgi:hypothetical protein